MGGLSKYVPKIFRHDGAIREGLSNAWESGIKDPFLGGSEKKAAEKARLGQVEAGNAWDQYFGRTSGRLSPYQETGQNAFNQYTGRVMGGGYPMPNLPQTPTLPGYSYSGEIPTYAGSTPFDFSGEDLYSDPGYQFRRDEALNAVGKAAGAAGKRISGNRIEDVMQKASDLASQEYGNAFNRAYQTSRENYGRGLTNYDIARQNEQQLYGRGLTAYDQGINQIMSQYGLDYNQAMEMYNAQQNKLGALADLANMGYGITGDVNARDFEATQGKTGTIVGAANAGAAGILGKNAARRGTVMDVASFVGGGAGGPQNAWNSIFNRGGMSANDWNRVTPGEARQAKVFGF